MTRFSHALMFSMLATGTAFATPAAAAILVDTGTPTSGASYSMVSTQSLAGLFTLSEQTLITSVQGFIGSNFNANGSIAIYSGGVNPDFGSLLFSANYAIFSTAFVSGPVPGTWQGVFGVNQILAAGQYWAVFGSDSPNGRMFLSAPNPLSQYAAQIPGGWNQLGSQAGLGVRIDGIARPVVNPPGAVPEPGTWAMMLIGFGAIGGALRARRRVAVSYG